MKLILVILLKEKLSFICTYISFWLSLVQKKCRYKTSDYNDYKIYRLIIQLLNISSVGISRILVLHGLCSSSVYRGEFHLVDEILIIQLHIAVG